MRLAGTRAGDRWADHVGLPDHGEPWPLDLTAENGELVTRHQELQVLGGVTTGEQGERLDEAAPREGGEFG
jgi:hypothetical protein